MNLFYIPTQKRWKAVVTCAVVVTYLCFIKLYIRENPSTSPLSWPLFQISTQEIWLSLGDTQVATQPTKLNYWSGIEHLNEIGKEKQTDTGGILTCVQCHPMESIHCFI